MRTCSALLSVALAAALAGCGLAPIKPAFAPGHIPTEAEIELTEKNMASILGREQMDNFSLPFPTDPRLLYLAALHEKTVLPTDAGAEGKHVSIVKLFDRGNLAAHAFGAGKFALEPPLVSLLSLGVRSKSDRLRGGGEVGRTILRQPSLTLIGIEPANGAVPDSPGYGARLDPLFTQADKLVRASSLDCQPEAVSLAQIQRERLRMPSGNLVNYWLEDATHRRAYICARRVAKYDREKLSLLKIGVNAFPVHKHDKSVEREFGYSGITGTIAQAGDPFVTVTFSWLDEYPHLGGNDAAWTLLKELKADLPEGWYYILSAAPPGETGGALAIYAGRKQKGELTMTRLSDAPK